MSIRKVALRVQKEQSERLVELLVACIPKSRRNLFFARYSQMTIIRPFIIEGVYQNQENTCKYVSLIV